MERHRQRGEAGGDVGGEVRRRGWWDGIYAGVRSRPQIGVGHGHRYRSVR